MKSRDSVKRRGTPVERARDWPGALSRESLVVSAALAALLLVFFYDIVFLGKTLRVSGTVAGALPTGPYHSPGGFPEFLPVYDNTPGILEEPYQAFKARSLGRGIFPLWNPHQAAGTPFLAALESSLLFVPEIVLYAVPSPVGWDAYLLLRLFLAGLFTYALARVLGLEKLPSVTAAVAYMFSGPILSYVANVTTNADLLTPLLLLAIECVLRRPGRWSVVGGAAVVFQCVAAGHPEHTFVTFLTAAIYALFRLGQGAAADGARRAMGRLAIVLAGGLGLSAVLLLPFGEYLFFHAWHVHGAQPGLDSTPLRDAITMFFPRYHADGLVSTKDYTYNTWPGGWIGLLPFWLALFGVVARGSGRERIPFAFMFVVFLLKVYGMPPVNWIAHLPIFELVKYPLHMTQAIAFSGAMLCGFAVRALAEDGRRLRTFAAVGIALLGILGAAFALAPPRNETGDAIGLPAFLASLLWIILLLAACRRIGRPALVALAAGLLALELFCLIPRNRSVRAEAFEIPPYVRFLRDRPGPFRVYGIDGCLFPDTATAFGLDDVGIYEGLFVKRFASYVNALVDNRIFGPGSFHAFRSEVANPGSRFLDLLNVRYFILPAGAAIPPEGLRTFSLRQVYDGEVLVLERLNAFPRAMIRNRAEVPSGGEDALMILKSGFDLNRGVLLDRWPGPLARTGNEGMEPGGSQAEDASRVLRIRPGINRKAIDVKMARPGILVVNDVNYPGWRARIDGKDTELLTANYLFQAVYVPPGEHRVEIVFRPTSLGVGLAVSLLSAVALLCLWFLDPWRRT